MLAAAAPRRRQGGSFQPLIVDNLERSTGNQPSGDHDFTKSMFHVELSHITCSGALLEVVCCGALQSDVGYLT